MADKARALGKDGKKVQARRTKDTTQLSRKLEHVLVVKRPPPPPPKGQPAPKIDMLSCIVECYPALPGGIESASPDALAVFRNVPQFCFPFDPAFTEIIAPDANDMFTFVLTDGDGIQLFGYCRHIVAPIMHVDGTAVECVCVISYLPWFKLFDQVCSAVALNRRQWKAGVTPLLDAFMSHPMPLPGERMILRPFGINGKPFTFDCPDTTRLSAMGESANLTELFTGLDSDRILRLFSSLLLERRIIVTANKLSVITAIVHAATELLYPLYWQHVFIPVVPPSLLDYCAAPMPYIIGVHASLMKRVRTMPLEEVVVVDVDDNAVAQENNDLDVLPPELVASLRETLRKHTSGIDDVVARVFLKFFVALFGPYRDFIAKGHDGTASFLMEELILSRPKSFAPFLRVFLSLQMFQQFIDERMHMVVQGREPQSEFDREAERAKRDGKYLGKRISEKLSVVADKTAEATRQAYDRTKESARRKGQEAIKAVAQRTQAVVKRASDASPTATPTSTPNATPTAARPQRPPPPAGTQHGHGHGHHGSAHARASSVDAGGTEKKQPPPRPPPPTVAQPQSAPPMRRGPSVDDILALSEGDAAAARAAEGAAREASEASLEPSQSVDSGLGDSVAAAPDGVSPRASTPDAEPVTTAGTSPLIALLPPPPSAARSKREVLAERPPASRSPRPPSGQIAASASEGTEGIQRSASVGKGDAPSHGGHHRSASTPQAVSAPAVTPPLQEPQPPLQPTLQPALQPALQPQPVVAPQPSQSSSLPPAQSADGASRLGSAAAGATSAVPVPGGGAAVAPLAGAVAAAAMAKSSAPSDAAAPFLPPPPQATRTRRLSNPPASPVGAVQGATVAPVASAPAQRASATTHAFDDLVKFNSLNPRPSASNKSPMSPAAQRASLPVAPPSAEAAAALPRPSAPTPVIDPSSVSMDSFDPFK